MTRDQRELEARRDRALEDLIDLDEQEATGDLRADDAQVLRRRYEAEAASAIRRLDSLRSAETRADQAPGPHPAGRRSRPRLALYAVGIAAAIGAAVLVPRFAVDRPAGGLVSGNEVLRQTTTRPHNRRAPAMNLAKVTDAQMEAVVEAHPDVVEMRLALAQRYMNERKYDLAVVHYSKVLQQDPNNAVAQAHLAWVLLLMDDPRDASRLVDEALASNPNYLDALWVRANLRLDHDRDAAGAIADLDRMNAQPNVPPKVRAQIHDLRAEAEALSNGEP